MIDYFKETLELISYNQIPDAIEKCQTWLNVEPQNAKAYHTLGLVYANNNQMNLALENLQKSVQNDPDNALYLNNLGNAHKRLNNIDKAISCYRQALKLKPNYAECYNNLGTIYSKQEKLIDAILLFEKAIRLSPNYWEAHYNLANCLTKQDKIDSALSHYQTAVNIEPNNPDIHYNLALSHINKTNFGKAAIHLEKSIELNCSNSEAYRHLADCHAALGERDKALKSFEKSIELEPTNDQAHHNIAVLYLSRNERNKALEHFKIAYDLDNLNDTAKHMINALSNKLVDAAPSNYIKNLFDQYSDYYDDHVKEQLEYKVPGLMRQHLSKVSNTSFKYVLDLGCGTGLNAILFQDIAHTMFGVDLSYKMLLKAKQINGYKALAVCDINQTIPGINHQAFDLILAADVFVYVGKLDEVLKNIYSALKNDGILAFSIENNTNVPNEKDYILQNTGRFAHSCSYIHKISNKLGFKIVLEKQEVLRKQNGEEIQGYIFILKKRV